MAEHKIGSVDDFLEDGEMKRLELEDTELVVARVGDQFYAFGGNCTHYGAPLEQGLLKEDELVCPWHHACFNIRTAGRIEPPALDDLPRYPVRVEDGEIFVTLPQVNTGAPEGKVGLTDTRTFVIVGGGAAGNAAAEELRRAEFEGKIIMISAVSTVPIDRPNLSKLYMAGQAEADWIPLRGGKDWYAARDIELRLETRVVGVDLDSHTIRLDGGETIQYDKLLLATGGIPRRLEKLPGADLDNIFTLRTLADADRIIQAAETGSQAVVIGASFIGMEVTASLVSGRDISAVVVEQIEVPFGHVLGERLGRMFQHEHEKNGVQFRFNSQVKRFVGENGRVTGVELENEALPADFVIVGIGVRPATDFLQGSGLEMSEKDHAVRVSRYLQSSNPNVYAAGDIARWDDGSENGTRIEHWRTAEQQGMVAARNMLGQTDDVNRHVPFFWTNQFDLRFKYIGHANSWDEIIYRGDPEAHDFLAFYEKDGKILAVAGSGRGSDMNALELIFREGRTLPARQVQDESFDLVAYAQQPVVS